MWQFYILLLVPLAIQHFTIKDNVLNYQRKNQSALLFFFVGMTLLACLRHEIIGSDTERYIYYFNNISRASWSRLGNMTIETGFAYFTKIITLFTTDKVVFLSVTAIVTVALIYPTYRRLCVDSSLTITLYVTMSTFVMLFSGLRQMLAVGIGIIAYECMRNKKPILFFLLVVLALFFHTSAFMLIFMYPLYHAKITRKWLLIVVPILGFVFVFNQQIFNLLTILLSSFTKYEGQINSTGAYSMVILLGMFAVFSYIVPDEELLDAETIGLRNFLLLSLTLQMFAPLHNIAMRMNYYYIIFIPLLLPKIIEARSVRWSQTAIVGRHVMVAFLFLYFFYNAYTGTGNLTVFPYHFFWETI